MPHVSEINLPQRVSAPPTKRRKHPPANRRAIRWGQRTIREQQGVQEQTQVRHIIFVHRPRTLNSSLSTRISSAISLPGAASPLDPWPAKKDQRDRKDERDRGEDRRAPYCAARSLGTNAACGRGQSSMARRALLRSSAHPNAYDTDLTSTGGVRPSDAPQALDDRLLRPTTCELRPTTYDHLDYGRRRR